MHISRRFIFAGIALGCFSLMTFGLIYLQGVVQLAPCPMCIMQRIAYLLVGCVALAAVLHNPGNRSKWAYGGLIGLLSLAGLTVALRQSYLIHFPQSFECGISPEEKLLDMLPLAGWWPDMFKATGDCAEVTWRLFGLVIPEWSAITFCAILAATWWAMRAKS